MPTSSSPRSRIPIRASSCPTSPKPRHLRLLHSGLITIPEGSRQSSADVVLTRMPRVQLPEKLQKLTTDKVLPLLPQSSQPEIVYDITPESPTTPTIRKVSNDSIAQEETVASTVQVRPPVPTETMPFEDLTWQEVYIEDQKLTKWTLSVNLRTAMDQTETHLAAISTSRVRYNCLISLCKGISESNNRLKAQCLRAIDQHQALAQKETQLINASNFVLEHNDVLISKSRVFSTDTTNSFHKLQAAYENTLTHAKESSIGQQGKRISKPDDFGKELESLVAFNKDVSTVIENIASINGLLCSHNKNIQAQIVGLEAEIVKSASKRGAGGLRKMLCFR
ncbi:hypothetical protein M436DRAFT_85776 [Aureobasidium namibiae CBS 147.97]|uniref:Uncharacterized protein n=1 Tax=Aureobasidium namibiae CBS 147.97 TaxID=1043004 RepID=A0A074X3G3_9PEZI